MNRKKTMRQVGDMKLYDFEEILEDTYGPIGTPERDEFENKVDEAVREARKKCREDNIISPANHPR